MTGESTRATFLLNDSTRFTINDSIAYSNQSHFYKILKHFIDKPSSFAQKEMSLLYFRNDQGYVVFLNE